MPYFPLCENRRTKHPFLPAVRVSDGQFGIRHCWPGSRLHRDGSLGDSTFVWLQTPEMSSKSTVLLCCSNLSCTRNTSDMTLPKSPSLSLQTARTSMISWEHQFSLSVLFHWFAVLATCSKLNCLPTSVKHAYCITILYLTFQLPCTQAYLKPMSQCQWWLPTL